MRLTRLPVSFSRLQRGKSKQFPLEMPFDVFCSGSRVSDLPKKLVEAHFRFFGLHAKGSLRLFVSL